MHCSPTNRAVGRDHYFRPSTFQHHHHPQSFIQPSGRLTGTLNLQLECVENSRSPTHGHPVGIRTRVARFVWCSTVCHYPIFLNLSLRYSSTTHHAEPAPRTEILEKLQPHLCLTKLALFWTPSSPFLAGREFTTSRTIPDPPISGLFVNQDDYPPPSAVHSDGASHKYATPSPERLWGSP